MSCSYNSHRELIETGLERFLPTGHLLGAKRLNEAVRYAIFPGGKRMRPLLALMGAEVAGCCAEEALPAACATEFLHASSLIFDDLPLRTMPTCAGAAPRYTCASAKIPRCSPRSRC